MRICEARWRCVWFGGEERRTKRCARGRLTVGGEESLWERCRRCKLEEEEERKW